MRVRWLLGWLALGAMACGGKVAGDDPGDDPSRLGLDTPPPSCQAICNHIVSVCGTEGAMSSCVGDCAEQTRRLAACEPALDDFLRCMVTVEVKCSPNDVVIVGCSAERIVLESCTRP